MSDRIRPVINPNLLNFAVFAFAVDDMNALDCVMTSAKPCAFLTKVRMKAKDVNELISLLVTIELPQFHQSHLLISKGLSLIMVNCSRCYLGSAKFAKFID